MDSTFWFSVAAVTVVLVWGAGLMYFDVFTPNDVRAWRRLAALRGFATPRSPIEKLASRAPIVQRIQAELDLNRMLGIANREETPLGFLARVFGYGLAAGAATLVLIVFSALGGGAIPPYIALIVWIAVSLLVFFRLRTEVQRRQKESDQALGDMLMLIAIMTDGRGLQMEDAVKILSRCVNTDALQAIVDKRGYLRLVRQPFTNTVELYKAISEAYAIPMFERLADAASNTNVGFGERDMYTRVAKAIYQQRLAEAKMKGARAKILVTIPIAGMLIPLLILIGAPALSSLAGALK